MRPGVSNSRQVSRSAGELLLYRRQLLAVPAEFDGPRDVDVGRRAYQLAHAGGPHQAGADARRKAAPRHGQHRHAHPHGIGRRRMGAVGKRVEEQVGQRIARQMLRIGLLAGEDQPVGRDAVLLGQLPQARVGLVRCRRAATARCSGTSARMRIQAWKMPGVIFCMPLRQQ